MKRKLSFVLAVVLILSVIVLPAVAADVQRRAHICPACRGTGYYEWEREYPQTPYTVSSCKFNSSSHDHVDVVHRVWTRCEDCGNEWPVTVWTVVHCGYDPDFYK